MSPNEALKEENWEKVKKMQEIYKKEFKKTKLENFEIGKMDDRFKSKETIVSQISENIYEVEDEKERVYRKHTSQLGGINSKSLKERDVGSE